MVWEIHVAKKYIFPERCTFTTTFMTPMVPPFVDISVIRKLSNLDKITETTQVLMELATRSFN